MLHSSLVSYRIYNLLQDIMGKHHLKYVCSFVSVHLLNWAAPGLSKLAKIIHKTIKGTSENCTVEVEHSNGLDDGAVGSEVVLHLLRIEYPDDSLGHV